MSAINEVEVRSLGELIEHATPTVPDPASGRSRDYAVYRGAADANATLEESGAARAVWKLDWTTMHDEFRAFFTRM